MNPFDQEYQYRDIEVQSNIMGFYEPRVKCSPEQVNLINHNHRQIFINEVVFDIDCHLPEVYDPVWDRISINLQNEKISHQCWFTSRSPHIHCFFKELQHYPEEARSLLKLTILRHYAKNDFKWIDKSKRSSNVMIREFNSIHEVTKQKNLLTYEFQGLNPINFRTYTSMFNSAPETRFNQIPYNILQEFNLVWQSLNNIENVPRIEANAVTNLVEKEQLVSFVDYCLSHRFDTEGTYKNAYLFKNIGIAVYRLGYSFEQAKDIGIRIARNCRGHTEQGILSWFKWCQVQRHKVNVNWREVSRWYVNQLNIKTMEEIK